MATEAFKEVGQNELPKALKALEENWPKHFIFHQLLKVLEDYKKSGCKWGHSVYVHGDFNNGIYLNKLTIQLPGRDVVYLYVDSTNPDLAAIKQALLETKVIPWDQKNFCFSHIDGKFSGMIQCVLAAHKVHYDVSPNTLFWFPPNKDCKVQPLPEDTTIEIIDGSYAEEMDKNWPHRYPGSHLIHKENLEKNFGLGLFRKSDKKLVASALSNYNGGIFVLFCAPEFRGRGFATILVQRMVQEIRRRGSIPYCTVVLGNKPLEHVFKKCGLEVFSDADYLIAMKK